MKRLWIISLIGLLAGVLLSSCGRRHIGPYYGVAAKMNFERQIINPKAPTDDKLPEEVPGTLGQAIYHRYSETYKVKIPEEFLED